MTDACNTVWDGDACQAGTIKERIITGAGDIVWDDDTRQACAVIEQILIDFIICQAYSSV